MTKHAANAPHATGGIRVSPPSVTQPYPTPTLPRFVIVTKRMSYRIDEILEAKDEPTMANILSAVDLLAKRDFGALEMLYYEDEYGRDITHADTDGEGAGSNTDNLVIRDDESKPIKTR
jgi:hypothetical protein